MTSSLGAGGILAGVLEDKVFSAGKVSKLLLAMAGLSVGSDCFWIFPVFTVSLNDCLGDFVGDEQLELGPVSVVLARLFICKSEQLDLQQANVE